MSFAGDVKKEITTLDVSLTSLQGELYGFLRLKKELIISKDHLRIEMGSKDLFIIRRICMAIKKIYHQNVEIKSKNEKNLHKNRYYYISVYENTKDFLMDLEIMDESFNFIEEFPTKFMPQDVIRGMFLARGSINDPKKERYHFEIKCNEEEECQYIQKYFKKYRIIAKHVQRKGYEVLYVKKSEQIGDCLKLFGISTQLFIFENERIRKDLNCVINRMTNCDLANTEKTRAAAQKQLEDIALIQNHGMFESLSTRLMEVATLRIEFPEATMQELSDESEKVIGRYLSKSGISHCFKDLEEVAKSILSS